MRPVRSILPIILATLWLSPLAGGDAADSGRAGHILVREFVRERGTGTYVLVGRDGGVRLRFQVSRLVSSPAWSPDGQTLLFTVWRTNVGKGGVGLARKDGSHRHLLKLDTHGSILAAGWSHDGARIVTVEVLRHKRYITIFAVESGEVLLRRPAPYGFTDPEIQSFAWSPDGAVIAFRARPRNAPLHTIHFMNADGSNLRATSFGTHDDLSWSPDGARLAFVDSENARRQPFTIARDGGSLRRLSVREAYGVVWSPEGTELVLLTIRPRTEVVRDPTSLVWITPDGRDVEERPQAGVVTYSEPSWQPLCTIYGTSAAETLVGSPGRDVICGRGGGDVIKGLGGDDVVQGGAGDDRIDGGAGNDWLFGGAGDDSITSAFGGRDVVDGGPGCDRGRVDRSDTVRGFEPRGAFCR